MYMHPNKYQFVFMTKDQKKSLIKFLWIYKICIRHLPKIDYFSSYKKFNFELKISICEQ